MSPSLFFESVDYFDINTNIFIVANVNRGTQ